ncbi:MAG: arylsulfatase [Chromatiales bacterium]|nr:arylsulfatase [Chromatiales bacterium]
MPVTRRKFLLSTAAASAATGLSGTFATASEDEAPRSVRDANWRSRALPKAPNIVIAVLDDVGFSDLGCYGSELDTSCFDSLAEAGIRFNNFHVTALCSPTRACLLTGRNAHAVGVGNIAEWGRADHDSYKGWIRQDAVTLPEALRELGYRTSACGKWHLSMLHDQNGTGPFDHWPTGRGFDKWYGFHGSAVDHFHPEMFENTTAAYPDKSDNYHLSEDLVDRSIQYIKNHLVSSSDRPFFHFLSFGATHFPLHVPDDYLQRRRGDYDMGWDVIREARFRRQKEIGIIPPETRLAPRNPTGTPWAGLTEDQQRYAARGQEVYAAFLEHTDDQLQRLVDFLKAEGQFDDTIFLLLSDNGATYGGGLVGLTDVRRSAYLGEEPFAEVLANIDLLGTEASQCEYAEGWAQASNTPLKWYKADTFEGGIRAPLIVSWPNGDIPAGEIRDQYHHAIDVLPTLLNMINEDMPDKVDGQTPLSIQGESFAYALDHAEAPTTKKVQYFETLGDRAIWADGWKAVTRHRSGTSFDEDVWELYHASEDFSETNELSEQYPDKLKELVEIWRVEAERYGVLPLEDDTLKLYQNSVPQPRATYVFYPGMIRLDRLSAPDIYEFNSQMSARVTLRDNRANGVILASGDSGGGYEWFMRDGYVHFVYVYTRNAIYRARSQRRVAKGEHVLGVRIVKTGASQGRCTLLLDDDSIGELALDEMWPIYFANSGLRCGENRHAPISREYEPPFVFDQELHRVIVDVDI